MPLERQLLLVPQDDIQVLTFSGRGQTFYYDITTCNATLHHLVESYVCTTEKHDAQLTWNVVSLLLLLHMRRAVLLFCSPHPHLLFRQ